MRFMAKHFETATLKHSHAPKDLLPEKGLLFSHTAVSSDAEIAANKRAGQSKHPHSFVLIHT